MVSRTVDKNRLGTVLKVPSASQTVAVESTSTLILIVDFEIAFSQYFPVYKSPRLIQSSMSKYMAQGSTTMASSKIYTRCRI